MAVVLAVDTDSWSISKGTPIILDMNRGNMPALCRIDSSHYLCSYSGLGDDGYSGVFELSQEIRP